jgi:ABC-type transport system substrate-binding protein
VHPPRSVWSRWAIGCLVAVLVVGACTEDSGPSEPRRVEASPGKQASPAVGGSVVFGVLGEPPTLDPYARRATDLTYALVRPLYPSLFRWDPAGTPVPYLAASLEPTRAGVRVHLAQFRWSDGSPITARDVVASIRRARPPSGFAEVRRARATDPRTVVLTGSVDDWEGTLATAAFVLPEGRAGRPGGRFGGPFVLAGLRRGLQVVYEPNSMWEGDGPFLERVKVQFVSGVGFLLELLERGDLGGAAVPSAVNLGDRLAARGLDHAEALGWESVYFDFGASGLDARTRRAVVAAVDRDAMAEGIVRDDGRVSNTLHPAPGPGGAEGEFDRAGRGSIAGASVLLTGPGGDELIALTQRIAQRQLDNAGASVEIATAEPSAVYGEGRGDPGGIKVLRSAGIPGAADPPAAVRRLVAWPLFHVETVVAFRAALNGIEVNPSIEGPLWNAEQWWLGAP